MTTLPLRRGLDRQPVLPGLTIVDYAWRTLLVAVAYVLLETVIGAIVLGAMAVTAPPSQVDTSVALLCSLIAGLLIVPAIGPLSLRWELPLGQRTFLLFLLTYSLFYLISALEVVFFTTYSVPLQIALLILNLGVWLGVAILVARLFQPANEGRNLLAEIGAYFRQRPAWSWAWRIALAALLFVPIYFFFGLMFAGIVVPYYNQMANGLGLVTPPMEVLLPVEVVRGLWYALTVIPLLAVLRMSRRQTALWIGILLAVFGAIMTQIDNPAWPVPLRVGHGVEMVLDSLFQGAMLAWLLWVERRTGTEARKP